MGVSAQDRGDIQPAIFDMLNYALCLVAGINYYRVALGGAHDVAVLPPSAVDYPFDGEGHQAPPR
jgi:hypothetical protein